MKPTAALTDILNELPRINPNIVLVTEKSGEILYINPAGENWFSQRGQQGSRDDLKKLFPPDFQSGSCSQDDKKKIQSSRIEFEGRIYDFKSIMIEGSSICMITITDVTRIVQISSERELYFKTLQNMKQALVLTDGKGQILFMNPSFESLYGYKKNELRGKRTSELNPGKKYYYNIGIPEEEYNRIFRSMWEDILNYDIGYWSGELPNQKKDGTIIWINLNITSVFHEDGSPSHFIGIATDISKRKRDDLTKQLESFRTLTEMAELRDNETGNHILRVGQFCRRIAEKMDLPFIFCEDIERFSPMHDIGKVGIPDRILLAERRLSTEEFEEMKTHTILGYNLLKGKKLMAMAAEIAGNHHEKFNGSGYPAGLKGKEIPLSARITAIADIYDALRSNRPYKKAWSHEESVREIEKMAGEHLDPELVEVFLSIHEKIKTISEYLGDD